MRVAVGMLWLLALGGHPQAQSSCPSQCNCRLHMLGDGSRTRTVVCDDPNMTLLPAAIPPDTYQLRLERTAIGTVPAGAFRLLGRLEQLWLSYNALSDLSALMLRGLQHLRELRLPGNRLVSFPWVALRDVPQLQRLDLQANRLSAIPTEAAHFVRNLTFLDLSSNQLMRLPQELLITWAHLQMGPFLPGYHAKLILGLQDNPWVCDCRLYDLVHFMDGWAPHLAFIEVRLWCASPRSLAGVAFNQLELRRCRGPELHPSVASLTSPVGSTALLRCGATGIPGPEMSWRRADGHPLNGTVHQKVSRDGMTWALLDLPKVSHQDSGDYICLAKNFLGTSKMHISLTVTEAQAFTEQSGGPEALQARTGEGAEAAAYKDKPATRRILHAPKPPVLAPWTFAPNTEEERTRRYLAMGIPRELSGQPAGPQEARMVQSLKVVGDTYHSVSLVWRAPEAGNTTAFNVLYAVFGQHEMLRVAVQPGKTSVTIDGLAPQLKYVACVCTRDLAPRKEQCIIFSTDEVVDAQSTQRLINVVVGSVAAIIGLPLTLFVCCGALGRHHRKCRAQAPAEATGAYVNLERLGHREGGSEGLCGHSLGEADRLLSSGSSLDSQAMGARRAHEHCC
ncbi:PREDICTED: leucine-rich repeat, immunoglobulin-like domain and transmembrane domain-containing protein 1 [Chrysochloris asiatica]|uniref:leucine-rich repeat, immunoglobulin-like domain and transmembrane domain-containing protein 1 n=1 Tax=Chrysochloris asiatica TaxID=185453 RepID=UPI0003F138A0|nr:PREDICTED: leucine-rich repeat, immunoglobulin-like domain and transmembrane domain-containing protein 1 [Chrysochloris asiatica]